MFQLQLSCGDPRDVARELAGLAAGFNLNADELADGATHEGETETGGRWAFRGDVPDMREQLESLVRWVLFPTEEKDAPWMQGIIDRCHAAAERFRIERAGA